MGGAESGSDITAGGEKKNRRRWILANRRKGRARDFFGLKKNRSPRLNYEFAFRSARLLIDGCDWLDFSRAMYFMASNRAACPVMWRLISRVHDGLSYRSVLRY